MPGLWTIVRPDKGFTRFASNQNVAAWCKRTPKAVIQLIDSQGPNTDPSAPNTISQKIATIEPGQARSRPVQRG